MIYRSDAPIRFSGSLGLAVAHRSIRSSRFRNLVADCERCDIACRGRGGARDGDGEERRREQEREKTPRRDDFSRRRSRPRGRARNARDHFYKMSVSLQTAIGARRDIDKRATWR